MSVGALNIADDLFDNAPTPSNRQMLYIRDGLDTMATDSIKQLRSLSLYASADYNNHIRAYCNKHAVQQEKLIYFTVYDSYSHFNKSQWLTKLYMDFCS